MTAHLHITGDATADALLADNPFALLLGMLLDQQVAMETAFAGPQKILDRVGDLDPKHLAEYNEEKFADLCAQSPAVHRYPGSMAGRIQTLSAAIVSDYDGDAAAIWTRDDPSGAEILKRLKALPGFGDQKARIFLALLGKQRGLTAEGWRESAGAYGEEGSLRSVADIVDEESLARVRENKKAAKAAAKKAKA